MSAAFSPPLTALPSHPFRTNTPSTRNALTRRRAPPPLSRRPKCRLCRRSRRSPSRCRLSLSSNASPLSAVLTSVTPCERRTESSTTRGPSPGRRPLSRAISCVSGAPLTSRRAQNSTAFSPFWNRTSRPLRRRPTRRPSRGWATRRSSCGWTACRCSPTQCSPTAPPPRKPLDPNATAAPPAVSTTCRPISTLWSSLTPTTTTWTGTPFSC
jgi:hypothetical protein